MWVLMSAHCLVEAVPGLNFLACATDAEHAAGESHGCDEECCPLEFAAFKAQRQPDLVTPPVLKQVRPVAPLDSAREVSPKVCRDTATASPPEISPPWSWCSRTAFPIRAPSILS